MGVEAIGLAISGACLSFGNVGSAASAVGRGVSMGSSIGTISEIGKIAVVNEGPVLTSLAGFKPMGRGDIGMPDLGGVLRPTEQLNLTKSLGSLNPTLLSAVDAIAQAELIIRPRGELQSVQTVSVAGVDLPSGPEAVGIAEQWLGISKPSTIETLHPEPSNHLWRQIEVSKIAPDSARLTQLNKKVTQENPVEQSLEEEVLVKEIIDEKAEVFVEKAEVLEKEEVEELRLKDLLDEEVAQQRVYEIGKAIDLAKAEADKEGVDEIGGWRIVEFLPPEHAGNRSQIVKKRGPDGSLSETVEELAARKFASKQEAKNQSKEIVAQKEPVRRGKEGKTVTEGAVERVFKHRFIKRSPSEEVARRVKRKQERQTWGKNESLGVKETKIEDYPDLAEVFGRAA